MKKNSRKILKAMKFTKLVELMKLGMSVMVEKKAKFVELMKVRKPMKLENPRSPKRLMKTVGTMKPILAMLLWGMIGMAMLVSGCSSDEKKVEEKQDWLAKGADVSWVTAMEADGLKFQDVHGTEMECMELMRSLGMNAIRLRVFVNPKDGWCNKEDVLVKALRAQKLGMDIMIDFHYSDVWADPGHQTKPEAWRNLSFEDLKKALVSHTTETLNLLLKNGVKPKWVQVGNEISNGMLWEDGKASDNMQNFAALVEAGHQAVKAVSKDILTIVHLNSGEKQGMYRWLFDGLKQYGAHYDRIGMSLYPSVNTWQETTDACLNTIKYVYKRYDKKVLICEVGMSWRLPDTSYEFLNYLITEVRNLDYPICEGVFYWEPQNHSGWSSYDKGAFNNKGQPTKALDAFKN